MLDDWGFDGGFDSSNGIGDELQDFGLSQWGPSVPQGPYPCPAGQVFDTPRGTALRRRQGRITRRIGVGQVAAATTPAVFPTTATVIGAGIGLVLGFVGTDLLKKPLWGKEAGIIGGLVGATAGGIAGYYAGKGASTSSAESTSAGSSYLGKSVTITPTSSGTIQANVGDVVSITGMPPFDATTAPQGFAVYAAPGITSEVGGGTPSPATLLMAMPGSVHIAWGAGSIQNPSGSTSTWPAGQVYVTVSVAPGTTLPTPVGPQTVTLIVSTAQVPMIATIAASGGQVTFVPPPGYVIQGTQFSMPSGISGNKVSNTSYTVTALNAGSATVVITWADQATGQSQGSSYIQITAQ